MDIENLKHNDENSVLYVQIARLTKEQRALIRSSYGYLERESTRNGLGLFIRLFAEFPQYKNIWPQFRQIPDSALISSDKLRNHAIVYMSGLKQIVSVMDDDDKLIEVTKRIAGSHCKWNICKYHIELWRIGTKRVSEAKTTDFTKWHTTASHFLGQNMVPGLLEVLNLCMEGEMTPEIKDSWITLYDIIGNIITVQKTMHTRYPHS